VMELVRGIKITDTATRTNFPPARLDLFIQVCHAVQHAHQKGIIHRDIKPSNILVTLHDGVPVPKVIDFASQGNRRRLTDATVYTQWHQFIGTPAYMSPEQAEMSGLDIDTRSDIYSLACCSTNYWSAARRSTRRTGGIRPGCDAQNDPRARAGAPQHAADAGAGRRRHQPA